MPSPRADLLKGVEVEFANADLGDVRRSRRLDQIVRAAARAPDAGFPQMVASDAELEGVYRLLSNEDVSAEEILTPHIEATLSRAEAAGTCLVLHDTTTFIFSGDAPRRGVGPVRGKDGQRGFFAHVSFAVMRDRDRTPLGVCGFHRWSRPNRDEPLHKSGDRQSDPTRESLRWEQQIVDVERRVAGRFSCIHVTDREGDIYDVLATIQRLDSRFVIRAHHDRLLAGHDEDTRLMERVRALVPTGSKAIELNARPDGDRPFMQRKKHPARRARTATIAVASYPVVIKRPQAAHADADEIGVNIVRVWEPAPPNGEPAVEWILYTSEPVDTPEQIFAVVDTYRCRWVIEELFKAIKTGCAFERRQLESFHALSNALALFLPIAWKMLLARTVVRRDMALPATALLTPAQLQILAFKFELSTPLATARDAALAVAKLGGHLRRNGLPGWQTLGRGFEALVLMQVGWQAALAAGARPPAAQDATEGCD